MRIFVSFGLLICSISATPAHACAMMMEIPEEVNEPKLLAALMDEIDEQTNPEGATDAGANDLKTDADAAGEAPKAKDSEQPQS